MDGLEMLRPVKVLKVYDYIPYSCMEGLTILFMYYKILHENDKTMSIIIVY